jgi:hypothetical protein
MSELFENTTAAMVFAFRYSAQQYALSPVAKMMKTGIVGSGKGLVSLDGAAQAGMIRRELDQLTALQRACIAARYANRYEDCKCCGSLKPTEEYSQAIAVLSDWATSQFTGLSVRGIRHAIIQSYYEKGVSVGKVADRLNVARRTAYDQKAKVWAALKRLDLEAQSRAGELLDHLCGFDQKHACDAQTCAV